MVNQEKKRNKEKGFVILIAVVVSSLLVSLGIFIANTSYKELILAVSAEESQKAFYAADSVMECAIRMFIEYPEKLWDGTDRVSGKLECNNFLFTEENTGNYGDNSTGVTGIGDDIEHKFVYFVSISKEKGVGTTTVRSDPAPSPDNLYSKVVIMNKPIIGKGKIQVYGHNKYSGKGVVERALEVEFR